VFEPGLKTLIFVSKPFFVGRAVKARVESFSLIKTGASGGKPFASETAPEKISKNKAFTAIKRFRQQLAALGFNNILGLLLDFINY
jgi:hypothetical protein